MVIENLKDIAPERKCFRLVGGVLVERTVNDVLPALTNNRDQVNDFIYTCTLNVIAKYSELKSHYVLLTLSLYFFPLHFVPICHTFLVF